MSYQLYDITYDYFSYPYIVKLNVLNDNQIELPSIIICTQKDLIWQRNRFTEIFPQINKSLELLEQKIISGIGNIYASEILFDTKIHPLKKTNQLTELEVKNIVSSAQSILREALKWGGTSEFDFVNPLSKEGSYQNKLKVYNRKGKPCSNSCGSLIEKLTENKQTKQKKRSTFFCPHCQKEKWTTPT